jgi:hypothetical protein
VSDDEASEENPDEEEPNSETEAARRFPEYQRWNVAAKGEFKDIQTSAKTHPFCLERAGDFSEDMQHEFFIMMSHILQSVAYYPPDSAPGVNLKLSTTIYKVFRFAKLHYTEATSAVRAIKIVLWYARQGCRLAYDLFRFRQVWHIVSQLEKNDFNFHRDDPSLFSDILLMFFYCVKGTEGEINWEMTELIQHATVSPIVKDYLQKGPDQVKCFDDKAWKDVWAASYPEPHPRIVSAMVDGVQKWSYAGIFAFCGITPLRSNLPVVLDEVKECRSSAGMESLTNLYAFPISLDRAFIWEVFGEVHQTLGAMAFACVKELPPLLQRRWDIYQSSLEDTETEEVQGSESPKEEDLTEAPTSVAQTPQANAEEKLGPVEALDAVFSAEGMATLDRNSAVKKLVAPTPVSPAPKPSQPTPAETPVKPATPASPASKVATPKLRKTRKSAESADQ